MSKPLYILHLYVVQNSEGKYFKSRGMNPGQRWVENLNEARIYTKVGHAKAQVTWYAKHRNMTTKVVILKVTETEVLEDHLKKVHDVFQQIEKAEC